MKIKICGLFRDEDIDYVNEAKPDYAGFVFAESRRQITEKTAAAFRSRLDAGIVSAGVFVNAPVNQIEELYRNKVIGAAQLHGDETADYIKKLKDSCGLPVIKVIKCGVPANPEEGRRHIESAFEIYQEADYLLFDSKEGGSGRSFDREILIRALGKSGLVRKIHGGIFLAGGINLLNIREFLQTPVFALDVSSGAETDGIKDRDKIMSLVKSVRDQAGLPA